MFSTAKANNLEEIILGFQSLQLLAINLSVALPSGLQDKNTSLNSDK